MVSSRTTATVVTTAAATITTPIRVGSRPAARTERHDAAVVPISESVDVSIVARRLTPEGAPSCL